MPPSTTFVMGSGSCRRQGCQMVCFQTKNQNLGKFLRTLDGKMFIFYGHLEYCNDIWEIL
jgi:hypothetical protein